LAKKLFRRPSLRKMKESTDSLDRYLTNLTVREQAYLEGAIKKLEKKIIRLATQLETENGRLVSTKTNFVQAQQIHKDMTAAVEALYGEPVSHMINRDMARVTKRVEKYLTTLTGSPQKYAGVDKRYIAELRNSAMVEFEAYGAAARDRVAKAMYEHLVGGQPFSQLRRQVAGILRGHKSVTGRPMTTYARQFAFDNVRNFQNTITVSKAADIGLDRFIYYGDVIAASRPFCKAHAGEIMTETRIKELDKQTWRGKSGPFKTHRGGYNCRHSFIPVQKEWVDGNEIEVQNYFAEQA